MVQASRLSSGRAANDPELPGMLPALLLAEPTEAADGQRLRRTPRDWFVDVVCFLIALGVWFLGLLDLGDELEAGPRLIDVADLVLGAGAVAGVWLRRRWPVGLAVAIIPISTFAGSAGGAAVISIFTVAVHRRFTITAAVAVANMLSAVGYAYLRPADGLAPPAQIAIGVLGTIAIMAWGMFVRARRQLVLSLRERAKQAEAESHLRVEQARHLERERIAREMHDVLAHRLSLLSVHAGALEYRPDAPSTDVARAAGVIRSSAHEALQDLREVIGVLRAPSGDDPARPQPSLADLPQLLDESRAAGMRVELDDRRADDAGRPVPAGVSRCAYRVVQEGLTNARKHAPHATVTVTLDGLPEAGLGLRVSNGVRRSARASAIPGAGTGLIGLAERVALAGGRLEHGHTPAGEFVLRARLPWRASEAPA